MTADKQQGSSVSETIGSPSGQRKRRRRRMLAVLLLVLIAGGGWYYYDQSNQVVENEPLIATVEVGTIENTITAAGTLKPRNFVDVGAQVSGQLQRLYVEIGDQVEQGQLLAEIDARVQVSRVDSSRASLESLEAQIAARQSALQLARANAERQERLRAVDATSELDYDNAMNNLASAEAGLIQLEKQIEQSRASLIQEETQLEFTSIFAPISGTVVSIEMNEGRTLNATQQAPTILRIADLTNMTVETQISEADVSRITRGMEVYFTTLGAGDRRWYGTVRQIQPTPVVESNVVLYTGLFDVQNDDGLLLPEMTAQVYFITSSARDVLTVPMGALSFHDERGSSAAASALANMAGNGEAPDMEAMRARFAQMRASGEAPAGNFGRSGQNAGEASGETAQGQRMASVIVVNDDGTQEQREVLIGVTSRVAAEVISGLRPGERVVAGILEAGASQSSNGGNNDMRSNIRMMRNF